MSQRYSIDGQILTNMADIVRSNTGMKPSTINAAPGYMGPSTKRTSQVTPALKAEQRYKLTLTVNYATDGTYRRATLIIRNNDASGAILYQEIVKQGTAEIYIIPTVEVNTLHFETVAANYIEITGIKIEPCDADGNLTYLYTPEQMVEEIGKMTVEPLVISGDTSYACAGLVASKFIELFGNKIIVNNLGDSSNMFYQCKLTHIPFSINYENDYVSLSDMFSYAYYLKEIPEMNNAKPNSIVKLFLYCQDVRYLPENFSANWDWSYIHSYAYAPMASIFESCYSLRSIPQVFLNELWGIQSSTSYVPTKSMFYNCASLDEVNNIPLSQASTLTSNTFSMFVDNCNRLKSLTFATNSDGTPQVKSWKSQTIDVTVQVGYANYSSNILNYNSGITADKQVKDDASYQALKNDPDWFTTNMAYSRYNHDSAVATINSLPDTSAYLATAGGTNTIKFRGNAGSATDGGAINTLTDAEIAVATAKGWTVTFA